MSTNTDKPVFIPVNELSYSDATAELDAILRKMQGADIDIDMLAAYTRRATELIGECRRRLTATDEELQAILSGLTSTSDR